MVTRANWRPHRKNKNSIYIFFVEEFLKACKDFYNNRDVHQIVVFTASVIISGHKHNLTFFQEKEKYAGFSG